VDLAKYEELTGTTVAEADKKRVNATIRRANALIESALGYSLSPSKNINKEELGKVQFQGAYPYYPVNSQTLLPADEQEGEYRLFYYNPVDLYIKTDPARNIYHVKLVQVQNDDSFVTIMDLNDFTSKTAGKFGKFIQKSASWFNWTWYNWLVGQVGNGNALMVAVDADWMTCNNMPSDLAFLWADMIDYYSSDDISVTGNLKSESLNGHSWSYDRAVAPDQLEANIKTLAQYAGPNGSLTVRSRA
jgi:hypothetical protein